MPMRTVILCAAFLPIPFAGDLHARQSWTEQVRDLLDNAGQVLVEDGFVASGDARTGSLAAAASERYTVSLRAGQEYGFLGVCDGDCRDLDLEVFDATGREVNSDLEFDDFPLVFVEPSEDGTFEVSVSMITCSVEPCFYGVGLYERPAPAMSEYERLVRRQLDAYGESMREQGYRQTHGYRTGAIAEGEDRTFVIRLQRGSYGIAGFCDQDCSDLNLAIMAEGTEPVVEDVLPDDYPALDLDVTESGIFTIRVSMPGCAVSPCRYGVAVFGKSGG